MVYFTVKKKSQSLLIYYPRQVFCKLLNIPEHHVEHQEITFLERIFLPTPPRFSPPIISPQ